MLIPASLRPLLAPARARQGPFRRSLRVLLGAFLAFAGIGHLVRPEEFLAQVPTWMPAPEAVVLVSGLVELLLAAALLLLPRWRRPVAIVVALFFLAILPGNIAQYTEARDAFGLTSDAARAARLALHPLLWFWALAAGDVWPPVRRDRALRRP
jgi:uncharacterized membrane protein